MPLDFNGAKTKPLGVRLEGGKLKKKLQKSLEQLRRHDPDVEVSAEPTEVGPFLLFSTEISVSFCE